MKELNQITFDNILNWLDEEEGVKASNEWEYVDCIEDGYELLKGFAHELFIVRHVPTDTYWQTPIIFEGGEGYTWENNEPLVWTQVQPAEVTETKTIYEKVG